MTEVETKLNNLAHKYLKGNWSFGAIEYSPVSINNNSVSLLPNTDSGIQLKPIISGFMKDVKFSESSTDNNLLYRGLIGFSKACRMVEDENLFLFTTMTILNQALREFSLYKVPSQFDSVEFVCANNKYFNDLENVAGLELRIIFKLSGVKNEF